MKRVHFEVLPDSDGGWSVTSDRVVTAGFDTKDRAVRHGVSCARAAWKAGKPAQLLIKGKDGRIQDERTYGNDPVATKG